MKEKKPRLLNISPAVIPQIATVHLSPTTRPRYRTPCLKLKIRICSKRVSGCVTPRKVHGTNMILTNYLIRQGCQRSIMLDNNFHSFNEKQHPITNTVNQYRSKVWRPTFSASFSSFIVFHFSRHKLQKKILQTQTPVTLESLLHNPKFSSVQLTNHIAQMNG